MKSLDELRTEILAEHPAWMEYSKALADYVNRKIQYQEENAVVKQATKEEPKSKGFFGSYFSAPPQVTTSKPVKPISRTKKLKGLYVYGGPGRMKDFRILICIGSGKTFTMDLFADNVPIQQKQRIHFNEFMLKVHDDLHKINHVIC